MITTYDYHLDLLYAFSKCYSFIVASTSSSLSQHFSYPISPFNTIIAIPVQHRPYSLLRFNSSIVIVILLCININLASAILYLRQVKLFPTLPLYSIYHINIISHIAALEASGRRL
jgi:sterol desaturase/sphingolipid hydroxylase (fatty acid hydroxylase superfamily)